MRYDKIRSFALVKALSLGHLFAGYRAPLLLRSVFGSFGVLVHFYALKHMPQADVSMLSAGAPALTAIFAWFILKEKISALDVVNVFLVVAGMVLILKPPFIFGQSDAYSKDPEYVVAAIAVSVQTVLLANVIILLRLLKG